MKHEAPATGRLEISGEFTVHTASERTGTFMAALEAASTANLPELVVDLSKVAEFDTAGLQVLLMARREAEHLGRTLRIEAVSRTVADVLAIVHLDQRLDTRGPLSVGNRPEGGAK